MVDRRICLWSGPRNVSTALMYAFRERRDTQVFDEPLYAHYLRATGVDHPGGDAVLAEQDHDGERVIRQLVLGPGERPVLFFKMMAKHLVGLDRGFLAQVTNVLLIRDPRPVLASFSTLVQDVTLDEISLPIQVELLERTLAAGEQPLVLDAGRLLLDPPAVIGELCDRIGIARDDRMFSWDPGPKPEDGSWGAFWYVNAHASTGFAPHRPRDVELPAHLEAIAELAQPLYDRLLAHAIGREQAMPTGSDG